MRTARIQFLLEAGKALYRWADLESGDSSALRIRGTGDRAFMLCAADFIFLQTTDRFQESIGTRFLDRSASCWGRRMKRWDQRPFEVKIFSIPRSVAWFYSGHCRLRGGEPDGMPFSLALLVLPLCLQKDSREVIAGSSRSYLLENR